MKPRKLTAGEIALARSVFGDGVNYETVNVFAIKQSRAHSEFGQLCLPPLEDYSKGSPDQQTTFIHEMTHVWQWQHKLVEGLLRGGLELLGHKSNLKRQNLRDSFYNAQLRLYDYKLEPGKDLTKYNHEQQAMIVQDYFSLKKFGQVSRQARSGGGSGSVSGAELLKQYESVLKNFLENPAYVKDWYKKKPPRQDFK